MYQALIQIGFLGITIILGLYGVFTGQLSLALVLGLNGAVIVIALLFKGTETQAKSLEVKDEELLTDYKAVCETWNKKPLPDF